MQFAASDSHSLPGCTFCPVLGIGPWQFLLNPVCLLLLLSLILQFLQIPFHLYGKCYVAFLLIPPQPREETWMLRRKSAVGDDLETQCFYNSRTDLICYMLLKYVNCRWWTGSVPIMATVGSASSCSCRSSENIKITLRHLFQNFPLFKISELPFSPLCLLLKMHWLIFVRDALCLVWTTKQPSSWFCTAASAGRKRLLPVFVRNPILKPPSFSS